MEIGATIIGEAGDTVSEEVCLAPVRWVYDGMGENGPINQRLQQAWHVCVYKNGAALKAYDEWRDVPLETSVVPFVRVKR